MKSKKLISFLCAAALTASSFAGLAVTASAAETTLWSDTFNAQATKNNLVYGGNSGSVTDSDTIPGIAMITTNRGNGDSGSWYSIAEKSATDKYLNVGQTFFGDYVENGRWAHIDFIDPDTKIAKTFTADATSDIVMDFDMKMKLGTTSGENPEDIEPVLRVGTFAPKSVDGAIEVPKTANSIGDDWVHTRIIVTNSGANVYVDGTQIGTTKATVKSISSIGFITVDGNKDYNPTIDGVAAAEIGFDNVVIYSSPAGTTTATSTAPTAQTQGAGEVTYEVVPADDAKSKRIDSKNAALLAEDNFDDVTPASASSTRIIGSTKTDNGEKSEYTSLKSVNLEIANQSDERSSTDFWGVQVNANTDPELGTNKYIYASNGSGSTANRGPRMYFKRNGALLEVKEREYVIAEFATRLHKGTGPAEVIFSGDLVASASKGNLASPLAMITTDATASSAVYAVDDKSLTKVADGGKNVLEVNDGEWVFVTITAYRSEGKQAGAKIAVTRNYGTDDETTTYIFGEAGSSTTGYADIKDSTKSGVSNLPYITFRSGNDTDYGVSGSSNDIDNIKVFSSTVDPSATPTPTPVPQHKVEITNDGQNVKIESQDTDTTKFDGVLIHVHYDSVTNALESIKSYEAKNIGKDADAVTVAVPAGDTIYTGDKLMVWNSLEGMVPYGVYTVQSGETPAVKYAITATNPENGTYTVQVDGVNAASAEAGDEVTITATPAQGYELDTITVKDADNADVTVTAGKFTMPAKAVTVTVTFKALPTPKAITKAAATNGSFTVKAAGAEVESALADTVITVTPTADQDYKVGTVTVAPTDSSVNLAVPVTKNNDGTYTFTMPDVAVTVTVTFVDDSTPADPAITGTVAVTGDPIVGSKLTATVTGLNDGKTAKYQWQANTGDAGAYENIADATANELTIPATLVGKTIKVVVTADGTTGSIESTPTAAVTYPAITGTVAVTGDPIVGSKLTATVTGLNEGKTAKYQWQANTGAEGAYENIANATTNELTIPATLVGKTIKVVVTADGTAGSIASDPTAAVTVPTYTVSGTVDAGIATVALTPASGTAINGTITDTAVSFANVPAGEYTVTVTLKDGYKDAVVKLGADAAAENKITVTDANITNLAVTSTAKVSSAVTFAAAENGNAYTVSVDGSPIATTDTVQEGKEVTIAATPAEGYAVGTIAVAPTNSESSTTVTVTNGKFTMPAEAVTVTVPFTYTGKFTFNVNATYVNFQESTKETSYIGERPIAGYIKVTNNALNKTGDSVDAGSAAIFSFDASKVANKITKATLKFDAQDKSGSNNTAFRNWGVFENYIDFDAVGEAGITAENLPTLAGRISDKVAKANDNWDYGTPNGKNGTTKGDKCTIEMDITDLVKADADGRVTMYLGTGTARATYVDNFSVEVESTEAKSYKVVTPTIPALADGTLTVDKRFGVTDDLVTITPTAATGRKLKKVTVNGSEKAENAGAYTHTIVEADPDNIVVAAEFTRADAAAAEISGANLVKKGTSSEYTIKLYDGDDAKTRHELAQEDGDVTWSVEGGVSGTTAADGTLTIAADETATELTLKATYKKNTLEEATGDNAGTATFTVKVAATDVYTVSAANTEHGSFTISKNLAEANDAITVTTNPDLGYRVALTNGVTVGPTAATVTTTEANKTYTFNMPAANSTVTVTFEPDTYTLTPGTGTTGTPNKVAVSVDGTDVTSAADVAYGKTVTLTPTLDESSQVKTLTVKGATTNLALKDLTKAGDTYTFTMPGENVTVEATFGTPATVSVVYTTDGAATGKVASEVIYDGWTGDDASSTDVTAYNFAENQALKLHTSTTYPAAYQKYKVTAATTVALPAGSDNLTAGDHPVYVTVAADTDTSLYYYEQDFNSFEAMASDAEGIADLRTAIGFSTTNENRTGNKLLATNSDGTREQSKVFVSGSKDSKGYGSTQTIALPNITSTGSVKVSFKTRITPPNSTGKTHNFSVAGSDGAALFGLKVPNNPAVSVPYIGATDLAVAALTKNGNGKIDFRNDGYYDATPWYLVEAVIDFSKTENNVTYSISPVKANGTADTAIVNAATGTTSAKNIGKFQFGFDNAFGAIALDDIAITQVQ